MAHDMTASLIREKSFPCMTAKEFLFFHSPSHHGLLHSLRYALFERDRNREHSISGENALDICALRFSYGRKNILHSISFSVLPGQICGLLGPNGSGKSTLFRCCMGFLHPEQGEVYVNGVNVAHMPPKKLAKYIAYVPQEHKEMFPFPVRDMVGMGRAPHIRHSFSLSDADRHIVERVMRSIGILDIADTPCNQLSGGQRQLVLIARAMAQQTPLILLDEPTSALDFSNQLLVWRVLRRIAAQGVAVLVCCHDPNHILWFCDTAAVLSEGKLLSHGPVHDALDERVLQAVYGKDCVRLASGNTEIVCPRLKRQ